MASGHKYERLDSLRGLAALSVGAGHALMCVPLSPSYTSMRVAGGVFNGDYAVDLFFVLSGFVLINMVHGFSGAHYAAYLGRRLLRLYPPLWVTLIVAYLAHVFIAAHALPCGKLSAWICRLITPPDSGFAAALSALPVHCHLDPIAWTVKIEIIASILYPLVLMIWTKGGTATRIATVAVTVAMSFALDRGTPHYLFLFVAGIALNDFRISSARYAGFAVGIGIALMGMSGLVRGHSAAGDLIAGTSAVLLIASVAYRCPGWLAAVLDNRAALKLGEISYSYYLLNPIVLWLIARAGARPLSGLLVPLGEGRALFVASLLAVCAALVTTIVAIAANRVIERPSIASSRVVERKILRLSGHRLLPHRALG